MIKTRLILASFVLLIAVGLTFALPGLNTNSHFRPGQNHSPFHGVYTALAAGPVSTIKSGDWSDPGIWNSGALPTTGDIVSISSGHTVTYDVLSNDVLGQIQVNGTLSFAHDVDTRLKLKDNLLIQSGGYLDMGTINNPIPQGTNSEIIWVLSQSVGNGFIGGNAFEPADKGLWAMSGSRWEVYGAPLTRTWSKLEQSATAGSTTLLVQDNVSDWYVGGSVIITPTNVARTYSVVPSTNFEISNPQWEGEVRKIAEIQPLPNGTTRLTLDRPLSFTHQGADPIRAAVGLLTRNILFATELQGDDPNNLDPAARQRDYAHTLYMPGSNGNIGYAEFRRMGNHLTLGRYPIHLHMLSTDFSNPVQPGSGQVLRGNSVWISGHRWYTIHDTNGALIEDNVGYNGIDHGFFLEKTSFMQSSKFCQDCPQGPHNNVFSHNLGVYAHDPASSLGVATNFWLEHIDQILLGNVASGGGTSVGGVGAHNDTKGGGFGTAEISNGSGRIRLPLFVKNEATSNFTNGLWTWNNNIPGNMAIIDFTAIRNGTGGMRWGAYGADYRFYQSLFLENARYGLNITSVRSHLQDSVVQGGSGSGSAIETGFHVGNYVAPAFPNTPIRLTRTVFRNHGTADLSQATAQCADPSLEKQPVVAGLISESCGAIYVEGTGSQFQSPNPFQFGHTANANSMWRMYDRHGFADTLFLRPDQSNPGNQGIVTRDLVNSQSRYDAAHDALVTPMSSYPSQGVSFPNLTDNLGKPFSYTFEPSPDYPPQITLSVTTSDNLVTMSANAVDDNQVDRIEFFIDEQKVGQGNSVTVDISNRNRKFAYLYARAYDDQGQVSYSKVTEIGPGGAPSNQPVNQTPLVDAGRDQLVTLSSPADATLNGAVSDDGMPNPPGVVSTHWGMVSGPAAVTFANSTSVNTAATFSMAGAYVLRLSADDGDKSSSDDVAIMVLEPDSSPNLVADLSVASGNPYQIVNNGLTSGAPIFIDRAYITTSVPGSLSGATYIQTANNDKVNTSNSFLSFSVSQTVKVYVAYDHRASSLPNWLASWDSAGDSIGTSDVSFGLYVRDFGAGTVSLGGNMATGATGVGSNYFVAVVPSSPSAPVNQAPQVNAGHDATISLSSSATLSGAVSDDGLPNPPGIVSTLWSMVSGPGSVTFGDERSVNTTASFTLAGTYVLMLSADDGDMSAEDRVTITVDQSNLRPAVDAGNDQSVTLHSPATAALDGVVSDDGMPNPPGAVSTRWSIVSGPSSVTFDDETVANTTATFTVAGTYVLKLSVDDGDMSAEDQVIVTVNPQPSQGLSVSNLWAASGKSYRVVNDGLAAGAPVFIDRAYVITSAPGSVDGATYIQTANNDKVRTDDHFLSFSVNQAVTVYVAYDYRGSSPPNWLASWNNTGNSIGTSDVSFDLYAREFSAGVVSLGGNKAAGAAGAGSNYFVVVTPSSPSAPPNLAPIVDAGADATVPLTSVASLNGSVSDDDLPNAPGIVSVLWQLVSGPSPVSFSSPTTLSTGASFASAGVYVLSLLADDGDLSSSDEVTITVIQPNQAPSVTAGPNTTISLPGVATLNGAVSDDGLPGHPGVLSTHWSMVSGPSAVTFEDGTAVNTTASFTVAGHYVLKLSADDGDRSAEDQVTITVNPQPSQGLSVSSMSAASGNAYQVIDNGLMLDARFFTDRGYTVNSVPGSVDGGTYIQTANNDKARTDNSFLSFTVNQSVTVYIAYDHRASSLPNWLANWNSTGQFISTTDTKFNLYARDFGAGSVSLGGNLAAGAAGAGSNYFVAIMPK